MPTELSGAGGGGSAKGLGMAAPEPSTYDSMYFSTAGMPTRWQKSPRACSGLGLGLGLGLGFGLGLGLFELGLGQLELGLD